MGRVIGFDNFLNNIRSFFKNEATAERTWVFPNESGTVALTGITYKIESDSHTLDADDLTDLALGRQLMFLMSKSSASTLTLPQDSALTVPVGTQFYVRRTHATGLVTFAAGSGATMTQTGASATDPGLSVVVLIEKTAANTWLVNNGSSQAWQDWGGSLAPTGFSSLTAQKSFYKDDGTSVMMWVEIVGTSNATDFTFSLPFALSSSYSAAGFMTPCAVTNGLNGNLTGRMFCSGGSASVTVGPTPTTEIWLNTGSKTLKASFIFQR